MEHSDWYMTRFPARIPSYWDFEKGLSNLKRDMHLIGKCGQDSVVCDLCRCKVPVWSPDEIRKEHAWAMGFFDHPDHQQELQACMCSSSVTLVLDPRPVSEQGDQIQPRAGVSRGPTLDKFYDRLFGPYSVNQMSTERALSKLRHTVGGLSRVGEDMVNFRLYKYNKLSLKDLPIDVLKSMMKNARAEKRAEQEAKRMQLANGGIIDDQMILQVFDDKLKEVSWHAGVLFAPWPACSTAPECSTSTVELVGCDCCRLWNK